MSRYKASLPADYFDERYAADPDPWDFSTSGYEREKYAATLEALPRASYVSALEVGCSIGVLTAALAKHCETLVALDLAEAALSQARVHCNSLPQIRFDRLRVPGEWPPGSFDLILLSEVVYYLDAKDVGRLADRVRSSLTADGDVVLVHWTGETHYPLSGDDAAELFIAGSRDFARVVLQTRTESYRLDVLQKGVRT